MNIDNLKEIYHKGQQLDKLMFGGGILWQRDMDKVLTGTLTYNFAVKAYVYKGARTGFVNEIISAEVDIVGVINSTEENLTTINFVSGQSSNATGTIDLNKGYEYFLLRFKYSVPATNPRNGYEYVDMNLKEKRFDSLDINGVFYAWNYRTTGGGSI